MSKENDNNIVKNIPVKRGHCPRKYFVVDATANHSANLCDIEDSLGKGSSNCVTDAVKSNVMMAKERPCRKSVCETEANIHATNQRGILSVLCFVQLSKRSFCRKSLFLEKYKSPHCPNF